MIAMKKFYRFSLLLALLLALLTGMSACSDKNDEPGILPEPEPENGIVDLSLNEMANCYIVQKPGTYKFKADNQFNLGEGLPVPPEIHPVNARLLWQTAPGTIATVDLDTSGDVPYVTFDVAEATGNAVISVLDEEGNIAWSWHIWMPETEVGSVATSTGYDVMDINLGAINNTPGDPASYGMLYQWGRKDPFPAAATLTGDQTTVGAPIYDIDGNPVSIANSSWSSVADNTIEYAIAHPTVVLSNYAQYANTRDWLKADNSDDNLWGNPQGSEKVDGNYINKGRKTCYDPCPAGWMVPPADVFQNLTSTGGYAWEFGDFNVSDINGDGVIDLNDYNYGWHFNVNDRQNLYFPAAARFDGSYAMLMGSMSGLWGNYWSNAPYGSTAGQAFCCLAFQTKAQNGADMVTVSPAAAGSKADAYSIRPIRQIR